MKGLRLLGALALAAAAVCAQAPSPAPTTLAGVLAALDRTAPGIQAASAAVTVTDYTALVKQSSISSGEFYFERSKSGPRYVLDLTSPADAAKKLVYRDQTAWVYVPASKQVDKYPLAAHHTLLDQYLLLGIGATGRSLTDAYNIEFDGATPLDGTNTVKLTLRPKDPAAGNLFTDIQVWYDPSTWLAAQQRLDQPGGDYHQLRYRKVELNPHLQGSVFSTRFPGATVVVPKP
ncbi:MAG: LolA family protein [Terriglobales bacterium]